MPTTKNRVHLTIPDHMWGPLSAIAKSDAVPLGTAITRILEEAIAREEDKLWNELAETRRKTRGKLLSHDALFATYR